MGYNQQNPITNSDDDEKLKQIENEVDQILGEIKNQRNAFLNETETLVSEIENTPDIPDTDSEEKNEEEELKKIEDNFDDDLDDAIIDLAPKEGEETE